MIKYDLIYAVVNRGFADEVMTAAKSAGAFGGTVVNARGSGTNEMQQFFGTVIQPEKEIVMILTEREKRNAIMEAICRDAGLSKPGKGVCFSMPVDAVSGIRSLKEREDAERIANEQANAETDKNTPCVRE
ncbi:MAG: P-II family nitrogen regulator [Clostridia bacterium]|nr:P-II family nitrogen regulator [Clostridia bacterium]